MSAAAVSAVGSPPRPLDVFRDDGAVARTIGGLTGDRVRVPAAALLVAGGLPLFAAMAIAGDGGSDGLVAATVLWAVLAGGASSARPATGRLAWAAPPLLRLIEYAGLVWILAVASEDGRGAAFALLAAIAFRHYDSVYRLRHQGRVAPRWVSAVGGGWDGRLLAALAGLLAGVLPAGYYVLAAVFAVVFVSESVASWTRQSAIPRPPLDDEDEEEEAG